MWFVCALYAPSAFVHKNSAIFFSYPFSFTFPFTVNISTIWIQLFHGVARDALINKWREKETTSEHIFIRWPIHNPDRAHTSAKVWIVILSKLIFLFVSTIIFTVFSHTIVNIVLYACLSVCVFSFWASCHNVHICDVFISLSRSNHSQCGWFHEHTS